MTNFMCRTCLAKNVKLNTILLNEDLLQRLEEVSGIEITLHESFPDRICSKCLETLNISYKFREMCRSSENSLLNLMVESDVKVELLDVADDFDEVSIESNQENDSFFQELIERHENETIAEIEDFVIDEEMMKPDETRSESSFEHIASDSESILSLINETKPKPKVKNSSTKQCADNENYTKKYDTSDSIMCEICGNTYKQRSLLKMHMRRHLEYKPFECEICSKAFACASELRRHMRTHTGEKPYVCRFCGRSFTDRSTNIRHERIHTNTRPYKCETCGKSFTYSTVLKNHMLVHTGEKKFACRPCNKTFSRKHQLDQHCATITHQQTVKSVYILNEEINTKIEPE